MRYDDGAAPNPFWGVCTLTLRKPSIRLEAEVDDWVIGMGSVNSPLGDISASLVYAMKVTSKLTLQEYDQFCRTFLPRKLPDWRHRDHRVRMGDCVYNYAAGKTPKMRSSIHAEENRKKDLRGKYALLSKQYYYFGDRPIELPGALRDMLDRAPRPDTETTAKFIDWIEALDYRPNKVLGQPQRKVEYEETKGIQVISSARDLAEDE